MSGDITGGRSCGAVRPLRPRTVSPMSTYMGTLSTPQRTRARTAGCPRKSLSTVPRQRGEVRRWRTSVRYADHVTTVACRWLLCPFGHLGHSAAVCRCVQQKSLGTRRFAFYCLSCLGAEMEYANHTTLYSAPKLLANQGFQMAKSIAADAKMTRLIVRSPGGSAAAILQAAFDMRRYPSSPRTGPSP